MEIGIENRRRIRERHRGNWKNRGRLNSQFCLFHTGWTLYLSLSLKLSTYTIAGGVANTHTHGTSWHKAGLQKAKHASHPIRQSNTTAGPRRPGGPARPIIRGANNTPLLETPLGPKQTRKENDASDFPNLPRWPLMVASQTTLYQHLIHRCDAAVHHFLLKKNFWHPRIIHISRNSRSDINNTGYFLLELWQVKKRVNWRTRCQIQLLSNLTHFGNNLV